MYFTFKNSGSEKKISREKLKKISGISRLEKFDCNICCEELSNIFKVKCVCEYDVCKDCSITYLLSSPKEAHCMNCNAGWGVKFMYSTFDKKWLEGTKPEVAETEMRKGKPEGWRYNRKKILLDREKSLIPETLLQVPVEKAVRERNNLIKSIKCEMSMLKSQIAELKNITQNEYKGDFEGYRWDKVFMDSIKTCLGYSQCAIPEDRFIYLSLGKKYINTTLVSKSNHYTVGIFATSGKDKEAIEIINWMDKKIVNYKRCEAISPIEKKLKEMNKTLLSIKKEGKEDIEIENVKFLCPCPYEDCRGMIKSDFSCIKCDKRICKSCREPRKKGDGHQCNKDIVENLKLVRESTKPCPSCAVPIHKIHGCDQMWCTQCKIAFSWRSGKIIHTGTIHNPHAIEWNRINGSQERDLNDIPCGGLIPFHVIDKSIPPNTIRNAIVSIYQTVGETDLLINNLDTDFSKLRMKYVMKDINEKRWEQSIFIKERANSRTKANNDILTTFRSLSVEQFRNLALELEEKESGGKEQTINSFFRDMERIRLFINEAFLTELPCLGTKKPYQLVVKNNIWRWKCYEAIPIFEPLGSERVQ